MVKNRVTLICQICGKEYEVPLSVVKIGSKYCSWACLAESKRGKPLIVKDREAWLRRKSEAFKGVPRTEEQKRKISATLKGQKCPWVSERNKRNVGPLHPQWKGGVGSEATKIRRSEGLIEWKKKVFKRDGYACGFCGIGNTKIEADHIRPFSLYPELRLDLANGQTLCKPCHKRKTDLDRIWYDNFRTRL